MATIANDSRVGVALRAGLLLALVSAVSFGLSGSLARGLIDVGWSPGAVVLARIAIAALVVAPLALRALRGRWGVLRRNTRTVLVYGAVPVAGTQFAYFSAVAAMDVGPALLIEYTAPAAIVVWLWLRQGERPRPLTLAGAGAPPRGRAGAGPSRGWGSCSSWPCSRAPTWPSTACCGRSPRCSAPL